MKRIICAVIAAGMLVASPWAGQAQAADEIKVNGRGAEFAAKMKERLGLSDEQAGKLKTALEAHRAAVKPLREKQKKESRKLEAQVRDLASDKDIQVTLDALDAGREAISAERKKLESVLASVLKPSQRAKMRLLAKRRMKNHFAGRRGEREAHARPGLGRVESD